MELKNIKFIEQPEKRVNSKITTTKKLTYEDTSLSKNKTYYYKVRAYYVKAGKNIYGSYSNVKSVKITK